MSNAGCEHGRHNRELCAACAIAEMRRNAQHDTGLLTAALRVVTAWNREPRAVRAAHSGQMYDTMFALAEVLMDRGARQCECGECLDANDVAFGQCGACGAHVGVPSSVVLAVDKRSEAQRSEVTSWYTPHPQLP